MSKNTTHTHIVCYWTGGREQGHWTETLTQGSAIEETLEHLKRAGFVAHRGIQAIGAPEGPPSDSEFKALGL